MMMEGAGFDMVGLRGDLESEAFVKAAAEQGCQRDRPVGPVDHDHAGHGKHGQGGRHERAYDHRGRTVDPGLCRPDRCRRPRGGQTGQGVGGVKR